jgi:hypothetical protein
MNTENPFKTESKPKSVNLKEPLDKTEAKDPYKNLQNFEAESHPEHNLSETDAVRIANMTAKQTEIEAPGYFTREEADVIKEGLSPAKQAEVEAQIMNLPIEKRYTFYDDIYKRVQDFLSMEELGHNEKVNQIKQVRQFIQQIEIDLQRKF